MEKRFNIFTHALLSILIVYLGAGITLVHCQHHGETMFAEMVERMPADDDGCHKATSNCMTKTVIKLSPSSVANSVYIDFHALQAVLPLLDDLLGISPDFTHYKTPQIAHVMPHGPPVEYLHFIRMLRI